MSSTYFVSHTKRFIYLLTGDITSDRRISIRVRLCLFCLQIDSIANRASYRSRNV